MASNNTPAWPTVWAFEASYRADSFRFRCRTTIPGAAEYLDRILGPFRDGAPEKGERVYSLVRTDRDPPYSLYEDDRLLKEVVHPGSLIDRVLSEITAGTVERTKHVAIHAGAASWHGRAVLLPAPPDSGKTTLTAALTRAGFGFLTDEAALIDTHTSVVHPFPRPLVMDEGSVDAISGLRERLPADGEAFRLQYRHHVTPEDVRPGALGAPTPVRWVVAPRYEPAGPTALEPITRAEGLVLLARNCFNIEQLRSEALGGLERVVKRADCFRLLIGDLESAVRMVMHLVGGQPEERPVEGEFLSIRERVVIAPHWGRIHEEVLDEGREVEAGTVLGKLSERGTLTPLVAPVGGVFLRWMVREGERVSPGTPVALLLSADGGA